ncbi:MAG: hypothetical protein FRX49_10283 [Trebouxia sp. A1-2]|nr:MAG: hypothetical protein FRX49_10283 [Trebouxia sp. A1-2]
MEHESDVPSAWDAAFAGPEQVDLFGGQTSTTSVPTYSTENWTFPDGFSTSLCTLFSSADEWDRSGDQQLTPNIPIQQSQGPKRQEEISVSPSLNLQERKASELHESKARQQQLTNRNALLEKLAALNSKQEGGDSTSDLAADTAYEQLFRACDTRASEKGPAVAVSVWGEQYTMGVHEVSQLSLRELSTLWTDYVRKLAKYLLELSDSVDCPVNAQMQQLTVEAAALVFCLKLYNPESQNAFVNGKMDEGRVVSEGPGPAMYAMLLRTLELSHEQVKDLLQLRRLYLAKRAQLMISREQVMEQMRNAGNGLHPGDVMTRMSRLATKLKMNAAEDYRVYNRTVCALLRGDILMWGTCCGLDNWLYSFSFWQSCILVPAGMYCCQIEHSRRRHDVLLKKALDVRVSVL